MKRSSEIDAIVSWLGKNFPQADLFSDSREMAAAENEAVFIAYAASPEERQRHIENAIANGAVAIVFEENDFSRDSALTVPHMGVKDLKMQAGHLAGSYYGEPSKRMFVAAITGTNGKTSCSHWIAAALSRQGRKMAAIGTLGIVIFEEGQAKSTTEMTLTTPEPVMLQRELARLAGEGVTGIAIEASSIGIEEGRMNGLDLDVALFTNLTRDHLDYHHDMASYEASKRKLFDWPGLKHAVISLDDETGWKWAKEISAELPVLGFTTKGKKLDGVPVLSASDIRSRKSGSQFYVEGFAGQSAERNRIVTALVGEFNVSNTLGVLGVLQTQGLQYKAASAALSELLPPPGRMQPLGGQNAPLVVIDYAHTPDALEKGLEALKTVAKERKGELWCVFGCGGNRDRGKRPEMGRVAELADRIIVTSDNPRDEDPQQIIDDILAGMSTPARSIEDRASAILQAVKQASADDVIFLAGKGHETWQEIRGARHRFIDAEHVELALRAFRAIKGDRP